MIEQRFYEESEVKKLLEYYTFLARTKERFDGMKNHAQRRTLAQVVDENWGEESVQRVPQEMRFYMNTNHPELYKFVEQCRELVSEKDSE